MKFSNGIFTDIDIPEEYDYYSVTGLLFRESGELLYSIANVTHTHLMSYHEGTHQFRIANTSKASKLYPAHHADLVFKERYGENFIVFLNLSTNTKEYYYDNILSGLYFDEYEQKYIGFQNNFMAFHDTDHELINTINIGNLPFELYYVNNLFFDNNDNLWLQTEYQKFMVRHNDEWQEFVIPFELEDYYSYYGIENIVIDVNGNIYFRCKIHYYGYYVNQVISYYNNEWVVRSFSGGELFVTKLGEIVEFIFDIGMVRHSSILDDNPVTSTMYNFNFFGVNKVDYDSQGRLWYSNLNKIRHINNGNIETIKLFPPSSSSINSFIWLGSDLYFSDDQGVKKYSEEGNVFLPLSENVTASELEKDSLGNIIWNYNNTMYFYNETDGLRQYTISGDVFNYFINNNSFVVYFNDNFGPQVKRVNYTSGSTNVTDTVLPVNNLKISNYPNPFNPETFISFEIDSNSDIELSVYNVKGQKVKELFKGYKLAGNHIVNWDGTDINNNSVSSGVYFVRLNNSTNTVMHKMLLIK